MSVLCLPDADCKHYGWPQPLENAICAASADDKDHRRSHYPRISTQADKELLLLEALDVYHHSK